MRVSRLGTLVAFWLAFLACSLLMPRPVAAQQRRPKPKLPAASWEPTPQEMFIPYWTLEPAWETSLEIRSNVPNHPITVTPVLRVASGAEFPLSPVTLAPNQSTSIDLRQAAEQSASKLLRQNGLFGSVVLRFSALDSLNIWAMTMVRRAGSPIDFHFDGADNYEPLQAASYETIWWLPSAAANDYLILSNSSVQPLGAELVISDAAGQQAPSSIELPPGQTVRLDMRYLVSSAGLSGEHGGISVRLAQGAGSVEVAEVSYDVTTGFAAMMKTFVHNPQQKVSSRTLHGPMVARGTPDPALSECEGHNP